MNYIAVKGYTNSVLGFKLKRGAIVNKQSGIAPDLFQWLIDNGVVIEGDTLPASASKAKSTRRKSKRSKSNKEN